MQGELTALRRRVVEAELEIEVLTDKLAQQNSAAVRTSFRRESSGDEPPLKAAMPRRSSIKKLPGGIGITSDADAHVKDIAKYWIQDRTDIPNDEPVTL
jgi:hypothetical protein